MATTLPAVQPPSDESLYLPQREPKFLLSTRNVGQIDCKRPENVMWNWVRGEYHGRAGGIKWPIRQRQRFGVPNSVTTGIAGTTQQSSSGPEWNSQCDGLQATSRIWRDFRRFHTASEKPVLRYR